MGSEQGDDVSDINYIAEYVGILEETRYIASLKQNKAAAMS